MSKQISTERYLCIWKMREGGIIQQTGKSMTYQVQPLLDACMALSSATSVSFPDTDDDILFRWYNKC